MTDNFRPGYLDRDAALPEGKDWYVRLTADHNSTTHGVFAKLGDFYNVKACAICAQEAHAGDQNAMLAVFLCGEDEVLQRYVLGKRNYSEWEI